MLEKKGAATVAEVLLPEVATCQPMAMPNHHFRGVDHPAAMVQPAVTEFPVLTRRTGKGCVKTADLVESAPWARPGCSRQKNGPGWDRNYRNRKGNR